MDLVQLFIDNIAWYNPTTDTDSWAYFKQFVYSIKFSDSSTTAETLKYSAYWSAKLQTSVDIGMWNTRMLRLQIFLRSNISLSGYDNLENEAIQFEYISCFLNNYDQASHNNDLWKSVNDSAYSVLQKSFPVARIRSLNIDVNPIWILAAIPVILYAAIKTIRISYYCPTEDTDAWNYFQNIAFNVSLTDSMQFCYNSTLLMTNCSSPVDAGMWAVIQAAATRFLDANLGKSPNTTQSQVQLAINFANVFKVDASHAAHNADLWQLYNDSFTNASSQLTIL